MSEYKKEVTTDAEADRLLARQIENAETAAVKNLIDTVGDDNISFLDILFAKASALQLLAEQLQQADAAAKKK